MPATFRFLSSHAERFDEHLPRGHIVVTDLIVASSFSNRNKVQICYGKYRGVKAQHAFLHAFAFSPH